MTMTTCPCTGAYIPRFALAIIVGFTGVFGYDYIVHHKLLMDIYEATSDLWRPEEEMEQFFPYMLIGNFLMVFITAAIFVQNYENKGIGEGLRYGIWLGLLLAVLNAMPYVWLPIPLNLCIGWAAAGMGKGLMLGILFSLTYKDCKTKTCD